MSPGGDAGGVVGSLWSSLIGLFLSAEGTGQTSVSKRYISIGKFYNVCVRSEMIPYSKPS